MSKKISLYALTGGKLASLEEFKVQKDDLMAKFAMLEEELKKKQQDHEEDIYNLEKKAVIDKDRYEVLIFEECGTR